MKNMKCTMLTIHDPVSGFFSSLVAMGHRYRCIVDGRDEFRGERLPVGTEEEIVAWIRSRYKILGELWLFNKEDIRPSHNIVYERDISPLWFETGTWHPPHVTKRYLVEVGEAEKVFVLQPTPNGLLAWHPGRALTWESVEDN